MEEEQNISPISSAKDSGLGVIMFDSLLSHFSGNNQHENPTYFERANSAGPHIGKLTRWNEYFAGGLQKLL